MKLRGLLGSWGVIGMMRDHDSEWRVVGIYTMKVRVHGSKGGYMVI